MIRNHAPANARNRLANYPTLMTVSVLTRILINTGSQLFNPFLTIIAAGLGTDVVTLGQILAARNAMALLSPLFGNLADRWGYRATMRLELLIGVVGLLLVGAAMNLWMAAVGAVVMGLGFFSFVPTLRAYLAELLPYERRARGFGILEYSWALSGIIGLYLMGQVIAAYGWRAPFFLLAAGLVLAWLIYAELPATHHATDGTAQPQRHRSSSHNPPHPSHQARSPIAVVTQLWHQLRDLVALDSNRRSTWSTIFAGALANFGMMHIAIAYGAWLAAEYGLNAQQLGTVALVIGCADLCGSVSASIIADRVGKWHSVIVSWSGAALVALLIPWFDSGLVWAVLSLVLLRIASEYGIISHMSLISGQSTTQRGKVMTLAFAIGRSGAIFASFTGPYFYTTNGVAGLGPLAALAIGLAVLITLFGTRELHA